MKRLKSLTMKSIYEIFIIIAVVMALLLLCIFWQRGVTPDYFWVRIGLYLALFFLVLGITAIYITIVACSYSSAKKKLRAIRGFSEERFEREIERAPQMSDMLICSDAVCYRNTAVIRVLPLADIVWAYQEKSKNIIQIYTRDKQKHSIQIFLKKSTGKDHEKAVRYLLRLIVRKNKSAIVGYEDTYADMYKNDFDQMLRRACCGGSVDSAVLEQEYIENDYYHLDFQ